MGRLRLVHNLNETITVQLFGITNASLHNTTTTSPSNSSSSHSSSSGAHAFFERHKKTSKHHSRNNPPEGSSATSADATVTLPPYTSLLNLTFNSTVNVVNATVNFTTMNINFTLYLGGIIFIQVLDAKNRTVLSGYLNQTDTESCKSTKLGPLSEAQQAAIGGFAAIVFVMLLVGIGYRSRIIYLWWQKRKKTANTKYDEVEQHHTSTSK